MANYIHVEAKGGGTEDIDFGFTTEEDPIDVIKKWRAEGGIDTGTSQSGRTLQTGSFIPWHRIRDIKFERNWKNTYQGDGFS